MAAGLADGPESSELCASVRPASHKAFALAEPCPRCGRRPGFIFGLRGFGLRLRGHDRRCQLRAAKRAAEQIAVAVPRAGAASPEEGLVPPASEAHSHLLPSVGTWLHRAPLPKAQCGAASPKEVLVSPASEAHSHMLPSVGTGLCRAPLPEAQGG